MEESKAPEGFGPGKSPLKSKTLALGAITLLGGVIAKANPEVGDWVKTNADSILCVVGLLSSILRPMSKEQINWRDWSFRGIGMKF